MPAGDGVWRVWRVLEGLERLEGPFGEFWRVCGLANGSFESLRKPLLWPGPGVPVGEVALAHPWHLGCMLGKVFGILEVWILCRLANGSFEAHRKSLLWPSEVPAGDGVWRVWRVLEGLERLEPLESFGGFAGWQTAALKA